MITLMLLLGSVSIFAQEFHGMAVYESKKSLKDMKFESNDMNDEMMKNIMERLKKQFEKTFVLNFNKYESVYQEEQKLEASSRGIAMGVMSSGDSEITYKNVKTKLSLVEEEFFGKEFLVSDSLMVYSWELQSETKKIGAYTCYKAVSIKKVTQEELEEYEKEKVKQETAKTAFFSVSEPKEKVMTVWYTPEIPVSHGPGAFWGLPGLILEASFDDTIILCSKIVLNPKDKTEIKKPKKGKRVTKKQYDSLMEQQLKKMTNEDGVIEIQMH
jgi:GLPGLI family protein